MRPGKRPGALGRRAPMNDARAHCTADCAAGIANKPGWPGSSGIMLKVASKPDIWLSHILPKKSSTAKPHTYPTRTTQSNQHQLANSYTHPLTLAIPLTPSHTSVSLVVLAKQRMPLAAGLAKPGRAARANMHPPELHSDSGLCQLLHQPANFSRHRRPSCSVSPTGSRIGGSQDDDEGPG